MTAPTFSYAQAAKGLTPSTQNNPVSVSSTPSSASEHGAKDAAVSTETIPLQTKPKPNAIASEIPSDTTLANGQSTSEKADEPIANKSNGMESPQAAEVKPVIQSVDPVSETIAQTEAGTQPISNGSPEAEDKPAEQSGERLSQTDDDNDKSKEIDDDWEKVSVPSVVAEKELKAAPIPVVNIWQQRMEIQEAKLKEQQHHQKLTTVPSKSKPQISQSRDDGKRKQSTRDGLTEKENSGQRRNNSGPRPNNTDRKSQSPSQLSPRSSSKHDDKSTSNLPTTGDTESWPTPESAISDEKRRSIIHDKAEKPDAKAANQKKWIQMPFVPTAKFETPLSPAANARRGGRTGNRGRDSASRGGHAQPAGSGNEKNETGNMGPPPVPRQAGDQDRGRKNDGSRIQRASSVPGQNQRSIDDEAPASSSKNLPEPSRNLAETTKLYVNTQRGSVVVTDESSATDGSRSSSQQPQSAPALNRKQDGENVHTAALNQAQTATEGGSRSSTQSDRNKGSMREDLRINSETGDRSPYPGREWSRGRPESAREKSDSWRERREPRPDRGRGGYRGRGNHTSYNNHPQTFTSPLPQTGFETSKPHTGESKGRQVSQPFSQSQSTTNSRSNLRSQSIPMSAIQSSYYTPVQGFPQAISPVQSELSYSNFPGPMPTGIMNSMPYADQLNSMALISMVITQLEYYFSINNLCKDLFLRKNMDSQGFVPLGVIANFKRIRALTDGQMSHEQFRAVCQQVPHVEFVTGDDGEDRVRARGNWRDFILPIEERLPTAQNDGPSLRSHQRHQSAQVIHSFPDTSGATRSPTTAMNGFSEPFTPLMQSNPYSPPPPPFDGPTTEPHGSYQESQSNGQARRLSNTSPFGQVQSPPLRGSARSSSFMINGHHRSGSNAPMSENVFPDDKIPELKVVVRDPGYDASQPDPNVSMEGKSSKLRGGASSPQQLEHLKNIQFGRTSPLSEDDQTQFWTKNGQIAKVPEGPSFVHENYLVLRHKALAQKDNKHFDGALAVLYPFWSTFLVDNFNLSMYEDFANLAAEEAAGGSSNGQNHLLTFYDTLLKRRVPISERMANDLVNLFRREYEQNERGSAFETLRAAMRNGATDFKTVKRVLDLLNADEKVALGV